MCLSVKIGTFFCLFIWSIQLFYYIKGNELTPEFAGGAVVSSSL
jgi:hypothetical protein